MFQNKESKKSLILYFSDIIMVFISYVLANLFWLGLVKRLPIITRSDLFEHLGVSLFAFVFVIFIFNSNGNFFRISNLEEFMYSLKINLIFGSFYAVILFVKGGMEQASRGVFVFTVIFNVILMLVSHIVIKYYMIKIYRNRKRNTQLYIITTSDRVDMVIKQLQAEKNHLNRIHGIAIVDKDMEGEEIQGVRVTANYDTMINYVKDEAIDEVFINIPYDTGNSLRDLIMEFENMGIVVHLDIEIVEKLAGFNKSFSMLGEIPVITFATNRYDANRMMIKRIIDIIGALVGILLTGIITIFLAPVLLIESPGPLIFKQKRVGKNGRYFYIYKFRSMYKDAEERKKALMEQNEMKGHMFKMSDDPRITKVGKFIRKTSLDEFPQFFNVLMGDMSLVGTRPPTEDEFIQYEAHHRARLGIKPGLTGMWQVSGRSKITDFEEVVSLDTQYISEWNLAMDVRILFKTIQVVLLGRGAE